jgi:hypothetical protein
MPAKKTRQSTPKVPSTKKTPRAKKSTADRAVQTKAFTDTHVLTPYYNSVGGRLKRLIKRDMTNTDVSRITSQGLSRMTVILVDLMFLMLEECYKLNTDKDKKMKITPHHLGYVFEHSPRLKNLGVAIQPIISTQPLPVPNTRKRAPNTEKSAAE